ncbi:hypothetical protein RDABS01_029555 [Bienertia sinuspersici]
MIKWTAPAYGWIALNTGRSRKRDHYGKSIGCFSAYYGHYTSMRAEFMALLKGLQLAWEREVKLLDVRMDNKACIQILNTN